MTHANPYLSRVITPTYRPCYNYKYGVSIDYDSLLCWAKMTLVRRPSSCLFIYLYAKVNQSVTVEFSGPNRAGITDNDIIRVFICLLTAATQSVDGCMHPMHSALSTMASRRK